MILITGASSGIGEATAYLLAPLKKSLILLARRKERLNQVAKKCRELGALEVHVFECDVTNTVLLTAWALKNKELLQKCEVLINNAGLALGFKTFDQVLPYEWDQMIDVNIKGVMLLTSLLLPFFIEKNSGHIVNLGSVAGHHVYPRGNVYCATKHAIHAFSQGLRADLLGKNIRVTEISPGMVETEFSQVRLGDKEQAKKVYEGLKPLSPIDVAETLLWCLDRPLHVNIDEVVLYPVAQASPSLVSRK